METSTPKEGEFLSQWRVLWNIELEKDNVLSIDYIRCSTPFQAGALAGLEGKVGLADERKDSFASLTGL